MIAGSALHGFIDRYVGENCEQAARHHEPFAPDPIREPSDDGEERHATQESYCNHFVGGFHIHFQNGLHIEQGVKLSGVPDLSLIHI